MEARHYITVVIITVVMALVAGLSVGYRIGRGHTETTVETRVDTIVRRTPVVVSESTAGTRRYTLPTYCIVGRVATADERVADGAVAMYSAPTVSGPTGDPAGGSMGTELVNVPETRPYESGCLEVATCSDRTGGRMSERRVDSASDSADSVVVDLPIVRREYGDSTYRAWVSGPVDPRLDSIRVYNEVTTVVRRETGRVKRWHVGPMVGVGVTCGGKIEPVVGVSISYSLISF